MQHLGEQFRLFFSEGLEIEDILSIRCFSVTYFLIYSLSLSVSVSLVKYRIEKYLLFDEKSYKVYLQT